MSGKQPAALGDQRDAEPDAAVGGRGGYVDTVEPHRARRHRVRAGDRAQQRGLARAVGADQGEPLALAERERHAADRGQEAVAGLQAVDGEQRHVAPPAAPAGDAPRPR
jgi:hypothetical protein